VLEPTDTLRGRAGPLADAVPVTRGVIEAVYTAVATKLAKTTSLRRSALERVREHQGRIPARRYIGKGPS